MRIGAQGRRRAMAAAMVVGAAVTLWPAEIASSAESDASPRTRIGISPGAWGGISRNDAAVGIKAWCESVMKQRGLPLQVSTTLFDTMPDLNGALHRGEVDAVTAMTDQFLSLPEAQQPNAVYLAVKGGSITERYLLVVRAEGGVASVAELRGRKVLVQGNSRASLAPAWLEVLLERHSPALAAAVIPDLSRAETPSKTVLQVFFRQAEAAVVTAEVLAMAGELNPQVRRQLRAIAESPELVPAVFFFRPTYQEKVRVHLEEALMTVHESTLGRQVLTVFQSDRMDRRPLSSLDSARVLLDELRSAKAAPPPK